MEEYNNLKDKIALKEGNQKMYLILIVWILAGAFPLVIYKSKVEQSKKANYTVETQLIKNPEAATPR